MIDEKAGPVPAPGGPRPRTPPPLDLRTHPGAAPALPIAWEHVPVTGPIHGFFVPAADLDRVPALISSIPADVQPELRVLQDRAGWFFLLLLGEVRALGAHPLRRLLSDPCLFHPADVRPAPPPSDTTLREIGLGAGDLVAGCPVAGRLEWVRANRTTLRDLAATVTARPPERPLHPAADAAHLPPPLAEPPRFAAEPLPTTERWQAEERREIGPPDPRARGLLRRLLQPSQSLALPDEWKPERKGKAGSVLGRLGRAALQVVGFPLRLLAALARPTAAAASSVGRPAPRRREAPGSGPLCLLALALAAGLLVKGHVLLGVLAVVLLFMLFRPESVPAGGPTRSTAGGGAGLLKRLRRGAAALTPGFLAEVFDRQGTMLERLIGAFDRGDLDLALRHSIPIDNDFAENFRDGKRLSLSWQLPTNLVDFSLGQVGRRSGGVIAGFENRVYELVQHYHRAAEALLRRGEPRKAAFIYAHLLHDYGRAAQVLAQHGYAREAAALYLERLDNRREAAEVLLRGGHVDEAAALHLEVKEFALAASVYERAGCVEEARRCCRQWVDQLLESQRTMQAASLLWKKLADLEGAATLFRKELATGARPTRGLAGAQVVMIEEERGGGAAAGTAYRACLARVRANLAEGPGRAEDDRLALIEFHRELRDWAVRRGKLEGLRAEMSREARRDLYGVVESISGADVPQVGREALAQLRAILEGDRDELAVRDLERGLARREQPTVVVRTEEEPSEDAGKPVVVAVAAPMHVLVARGTKVFALELSGKVERISVEGGFVVRALACRWDEGTFAAADADDFLAWIHRGTGEKVTPIKQTFRAGCVGVVVDGRGFVVGTLNRTVWIIGDLPNVKTYPLGPTVPTCCGDLRGYHLFGGEGPNVALVALRGDEVRVLPLFLNLVNGGVKFIATNRRDIALIAGTSPCLVLAEFSSTAPVTRFITGVPLDGLTAGAVLGTDAQGCVRLALGYDSGDVLLVRLDKQRQFAGRDRIHNPGFASVAGLAAWPGTRHCLAVAPDLSYAIIGDDPQGPTVRRGRLPA